jgi:hypothetical protein
MRVCVCVCVCVCVTLITHAVTNSNIQIKTPTPYRWFPELTSSAQLHLAGARPAAKDWPNLYAVRQRPTEWHVRGASPAKDYVRRRQGPSSEFGCRWMRQSSSSSPEGLPKKPREKKQHCRAWEQKRERARRSKSLCFDRLYQQHRDELDPSHQ